MCSDTSSSSRQLKEAEEVEPLTFSYAQCNVSLHLSQKLCLSSQLLKKRVSQWSSNPSLPWVSSLKLMTCSQRTSLRKFRRLLNLWPSQSEKTRIHSRRFGEELKKHREKDSQSGMEMCSWMWLLIYGTNYSITSTSWSITTLCHSLASLFSLLPFIINNCEDDVLKL